MSTRENLSYREAAREPPVRIGYGPLPPDPIGIAWTVACFAIALASFASAESSSVVECTRERVGDAPVCVRRTRLLRAREVERTSPAVLRRDSVSAGLPIDVLEYDGITLMLPNNPPGPLSELLDTPTELRARTSEHDALHGGFFVVLFAALGAFGLPRLLDGAGRRALVVDRTGRMVSLGTTGKLLELSFDDVDAVRVETFGDDLVSKLRGARVCVRRTDGTVLALATYGRPPYAHSVRVATKLAKALGVTVEVVRAPSLRGSAPMRSVWLVAQVVAALATAFALVLALR
jgi:hypothetical protein